MFIRSSLSLARKVGAACLIVSLASSALAAPQKIKPAPARFGSSVATAPGNLQFEALPLERSGQNHLLLRATINGKPALLNVDTGAPFSAIALSRVRYFGMTPAVAKSEIPTRLRINGAFAGVAMARTLRLGALTLVDEPMVAVDLSSSTKAARMMKEQAIDGIIGADILFPTNAVIDCREQVLILKIDPHARGSVPGMDYRGFTSVPIEVSPGFNLYVNGTFNGRRGKLLIDTGAFATLLHQRFVRRMRIPLRDSSIRSAGVNLKQRDLQLATISRFSVGSMDLRTKEVGVIDLGELFRGPLLIGSTPVAGLLGSEMLRRHYGIIDFGTRTLYLKE